MSKICPGGKLDFTVLRSHLLVGFDGVPEFRRVLDLQFVTGVVGLGSYASRIPEGQVKSFLERNSWDRDSVGSLLESWKPDYVEGNTVVLSGAFGGVEGLVRRIDQGDRVSRVIVPFLGSEREIEIPWDAARLP